MKRLVLFVLACATFLGCVLEVSAEEITFDIIVNAMKSSETYNYFNTSGGTAEIVSSPNSMAINYNYTTNERGSWTTVFNYKDGVVSYSYPGERNSANTVTYTSIDRRWITQLLSIVAELNGFTQEQMLGLDNNYMSTFTMENNGLASTMFNYSYINSDGSTSSGSAYDTFQINLNRFRFDVTQAKEGVPTLKVSKVDNNSVVIGVSSSSGQTCNLYRGTNENNMELLGSVSCNGATYTDKNLKANNTYFYKANIDGSSNYSKTLSVKTTSKTVDNPKTGVYFSYLLVLEVLVISLGGLWYLSRKKRVFRNF